MELTTLRPDVAPVKDWDDIDALTQVRAGNASAFEFIVRRHNQRLYRICRSILGSDADAEDALQDAYVRAFTHIGQLDDDAQLGGWLARIARNEALQHLRRRRDVVLGGWPEDAPARAENAMIVNDVDVRPSEEAVAASELRKLLEEGIDALPEEFRVTLVLRAVEGMSVAEVASVLDIPPDTVKSRTHRARLRLQRYLGARLEQELTGAFPFAGARCDGTVRRVLRRLGLPAGGEHFGP